MKRHRKLKPAVKFAIVSILVLIMAKIYMVSIGPDPQASEAAILTLATITVLFSVISVGKALMEIDKPPKHKTYKNPRKF